MQIDTSLTFGDMDKEQLQMEILHIVEWLLNEESFPFTTPQKKATELIKEYVRCGSLPGGDILKPRFEHWIVEGILPGFVGMNDFCTQLMNKVRYYTSKDGINNIEVLNLDGGKQFKSIKTKKRGRKFDMNLIQQETPTKKRVEKEQVKKERQLIQQQKINKAYELKMLAEKHQIETDEQNLLYDDLLIASIKTSAAERAKLTAEQERDQVKEELQKLKDAAADQAREVEELKADILRLQQGPVNEAKDKHQVLKDILIKCIFANQVPISQGGLVTMSILSLQTPFGLELIDVDLRPVTSFRLLVKLLCFLYEGSVDFWNLQNTMVTFVPQMLCIIHQMIGCLVKLWTKQLQYNIIPLNELADKRPLGMFLDEEIFVNEMGLMTINEQVTLQEMFEEIRQRYHVDVFDYGKQKVTDDSYVLLGCFEQMLKCKFLTRPYYLKEYVVADMVETIDFSKFLFRVPTDEENFNSIQATMMNDMFAVTHPYVYDRKVEYRWTEQVHHNDGTENSVSRVSTVYTLKNLHCVDDKGFKIMEDMDDRAKDITGQHTSEAFVRRKTAVIAQPTVDIWYTDNQEIRDVFKGMWPTDAVDINFISEAKGIIQTTCFFDHINVDDMKIPAAWNITMRRIGEPAPVEQQLAANEQLDDNLIAVLDDEDMDQVNNGEAELDHLINLVYDASNERASNSADAFSQQTIQKKEAIDPVKQEFIKEFKKRHDLLEDFTLPSVGLEQILKNEQHRLRNLLIQILGESNTAHLSFLKKKFEESLRSESSRITKSELDSIKFCRRRIKEIEEVLAGRGSFTKEDLLVFICEQADIPVYYRDLDTEEKLKEQACTMCSWTVGVYEPHFPQNSLQMQRYKCPNLKCKVYYCWTCLKKNITYDLADLQPRFNECLCGTVFVRKGMGNYNINDQYEHILARLTKTAIAYNDMVKAVDKDKKALKPNMNVEQVWEHQVLVEEKKEEENRAYRDRAMAAHAEMVARRAKKQEEEKRQEE